MNTKQVELLILMASLVMKMGMIILRALAVVLIGLVSAVIGLILGAIVGGTLAAIYELAFGYEFVFKGRVGYEGTGQIGLILGALIGLVASSVRLFGKRIER